LSFLVVSPRATRHIPSRKMAQLARIGVLAWRWLCGGSCHSLRGAGGAGGGVGGVGEGPRGWPWDVVFARPEDGVSFIKALMIFGAVSGLLASLPCCGLLFWSWSQSGLCNWSLRNWLLMHSLLLLIQVPVQLALFFHISQAQSRGRGAPQILRQLTASQAWRRCATRSKVATCSLIYGTGGLVFGPCADCGAMSTCGYAVLCVCIARTLVSLVMFFYHFPHELRTVGRALSRMAELQASSFDDSDEPEDTEDEAAEDEQPPIRRGATEEVIRRSPLIDCSEEDLASTQQSSCAVCMLDFQVGEKLRELPCGHDFHGDCIDKWLGRNKVCPLCNHDISEPPTKWGREKSELLQHRQPRRSKTSPP